LVINLSPRARKAVHVSNTDPPHRTPHGPRHSNGFVFIKIYEFVKILTWLKIIKISSLDITRL